MALITVRVTDEEHQQMIEAAKYMDTTLSQVVRRALRSLVSSAEQAKDREQRRVPPLAKIQEKLAPAKVETALTRQQRRALERELAKGKKG